MSVDPALWRRGVLSNVPEGLIAGRCAGGYLRLPDMHHVLVTAPPGARAAIVHANCLTWPGSLVIVDVDGEAYRRTAGYRRTLGPVYRFDPFTDQERSHRWNPLGYIRLHPEGRGEDLARLAAAVYPVRPHLDPFWTAKARTTFETICWTLFETYLDLEAGGYPYSTDHYPTFGRLRRVLAEFGYAHRGASDQEALEGWAAQGRFSERTRIGLRHFAGLSRELRWAVVARMLEPLHAFTHPLVEAATSANDIDLTCMHGQVQTLYITLSSDRLDEAGWLANVLLDQALGCAGGALSPHVAGAANEDVFDHPTIGAPCLFLLDAFTRLGNVARVPELAGAAADERIRLVIAIESVKSLEEVYGAQGARTLIHRCGSHLEVASDMAEVTARIHGVGAPVRMDPIAYEQDLTLQRRRLEAPEVPRLKRKQHFANPKGRTMRCRG